MTTSAVPDEHSPEVGGLESTGTQPGRLDQYQPGRLILTAGPIPSLLILVAAFAQLVLNSWM